MRFQPDLCHFGKSIITWKLGSGSDVAYVHRDSPQFKGVRRANGYLREHLLDAANAGILAGSQVTSLDFTSAGGQSHFISALCVAAKPHHAALAYTVVPTTTTRLRVKC